MYSNKKNISTGYNILANEKCASLDYKYGPYASKEQAMEVLGEDGLDVIAIGLTVGILDNDEGIVEYQFKKGVTLNDLVRKFPQASASSDSGYNVPEGSTADTTPEIDSDKEVQAFLEGVDNTKTLVEILNEQDKDLTEEQMQTLKSMFPTE